jgi:hypothetical protein
MPTLTPPAPHPVAESRSAARGIDPVPHLEWGRRLAVHVANRCRFHHQEREDVISVAYIEVIRLARRFDPARLEYGEPGHLFRGWAKRSILSACKRAADALRCGGVSGVVRAAAGGRLVVVEPLSDQRTPGGDRMEFAFTGLVSERDAA